MENYIGKCLDSLIIPEFDEVEVLVVSDGSKDNSSAIAHEYAERYPYSIRVIDKENGNYGSCINAALPLCSGRYVRILDADDSFDTAAFSEFVRALRGMNSDVILTKFLIVDEMGDVTDEPGFNRWNIKVDRTYIGKELVKLLQRTYIPMHHITYKRDIFSQLNYIQSEGISYTDTQWSIIPLARCRSLIFKDITLYKYLVGRAGQTMAQFSTPKAIATLLKIMRDICSVYGTIQDPLSKTILQNLITSRHIAFYMCAYNIKSQEAMNMIKEHEQFLNKEHPLLFELLNTTPCDDDPDYRFAKILRDSEYSLKIKLPLIDRLIMSFRARMRHLFKK